MTDNNQQPLFTIRKYGRYFAVYDQHEKLVVVALYLKGAINVCQRMGASFIYTK